jgi:hypothetical protein
VTERPGEMSPLVSVVTPSLNQARYLEAAIASVLGQDYPHVEYIVVDGGSTDGSREILASFGSRLRFISEKDSGQAEALNKGFHAARGSILGWLNADDVYAPGAIAKVVEAFRSRPSVHLVYGGGSILDQDGNVVGPFEEIEPFSLWRLLHVLDYVLQPAAFFRRDAAFAAGLLDEGLHWALDWDLWIRLAARGEVLHLGEPLASSRVHARTKTSTGGWPRIRELGRLAERHTGDFWTPGVKLYALDTLFGRLGRNRPWLRQAVLALERRVASTIVERLPLHADGWLGRRGRLAVPRRWEGVLMGFEAHRLPARRPLTVDVSAEGRRLARTVVDRPGRFDVRCPLPAGPRPFVELEVESDFGFRAPPDRRRLAIRCRTLSRWDAPRS